MERRTFLKNFAIGLGIVTMVPATISEIIDIKDMTQTEPGELTLALVSNEKEVELIIQKLYAKYKDMDIKKQEILRCVDDAELFPFLDLNQKSDQMKFSTLLTRYEGRILSNVRFIVTKPSDRTARKEYKFTKIKPDKKIFDFDEPVKLETDAPIIVDVKK